MPGFDGTGPGGMGPMTGGGRGRCNPYSPFYLCRIWPLPRFLSLSALHSDGYRLRSCGWMANWGLWLPTLRRLSRALRLWASPMGHARLRGPGHGLGRARSRPGTLVVATIDHLTKDQLTN